MENMLHMPQDDTYRLFVPISDDLIKSITVDENGDYIVQGVMTSDSQDEEGDSISPHGMDCTYFLEKGWIKYEHGNSPEQFIGEPIAVNVGRFVHPTSKKSVNGIFVKGRLFAGRGLTKKAVEAITEIQKSNTTRRMGWSIEGNTVKRDKSGKIIKSVLRNVVLTMNPINTTTWAELAKSFAKDHELTIDMDNPLDKAMDLGNTEALHRQSLEGAHNRFDEEDKEKDKDPQQRVIDVFRAFVKENMLRKSHLMGDADYITDSAYFFAVDQGFDDEEAESFASYIATKQTIFKSLANFIGGAFMGNDTQKMLANILDEDLEELQKSLAFDTETEEDEDETLEKSFEDKEDGGDTSEDDEDTSEDDEDTDDDDDDDDEDVSKSIESDFSKSFSHVPENQQALEVSDFLSNLVDEIGMYMGGFEKSMQTQRKQSNAVVQAVTSMGDLVKSLAQELAEVKANNADLQKSLDEMMSLPIGRRSVVSNREAQTLQKSMNAGGNQPPSKASIGDILMKSFEAGDLSGSEIARFEAGVPLQNLQLPQALRENLGLV